MTSRLDKITGPVPIAVLHAIEDAIDKHPGMDHEQIAWYAMASLLAVPLVLVIDDVKRERHPEDYVEQDRFDNATRAWEASTGR